jgi:hypothetical protein
MTLPPDRHPMAVQQCEFYFECCAAWGIKPEKDLACVRERRCTVDECPQIVERGGQRAFEALASSGEGSSGD